MERGLAAEAHWATSSLLQFPLILAMLVQLVLDHSGATLGLLPFSSAMNPINLSHRSEFIRMP
eukprot:CCRYP_009000-RA/>CCRYP_009000-RA protein AED:0.01 eAED:0.01 QI:0/0/0.5/0.5/0/0/2/2272/62